MPATEFTIDEARALDETPLWPRLLVIPAGWAGFALLLLDWRNGPWSLQAVIVVATAYCLLCWTSCLHETAHQTLCSSRRWNVALGKVLGTSMLLPYTVYRESHIRHHAYLNQPSDWELWPYSDPRSPRWFRRLFVWCDLFCGWLVNPCVYGRIYFHADSPIRLPETRREIRREYRAVVILWLIVIAAILIAYRTYGAARLGWVWLLPIPLSGMLQSARKLTEHLGMQSYDPLLGTRSVVGRNWITRICTWLNFDIFVHGPHHRYPKVAHHRLAETLRAYETQDADRTPPVFDSYHSAVLDMLPALWRNPGVGMNVGAPPPEKQGPGDCENFVQDVVRDLVVVPETDR